MPNHITNIIEIKDTGGISIEEITVAILDEKGEIDFNKVIKMPECLSDFNPHSRITTTAEALLGLSLDKNALIALIQQQTRQRALSRIDDMPMEDRAQVDRAISNHKECGFMYWYDWQVKSWGTKWNAYEQSREGNTLRFDTAWSHPIPIVYAISKQFPLVKFNIKYADEDTGRNCGKYSVQDGVMSDEDIAPSQEITDDERRKYNEFAFNVRYEGVDPRSHGFDKDWQYSEEVYEQYENEHASGA